VKQKHLTLIYFVGCLFLSKYVEVDIFPLKPDVLKFQKRWMECKLKTKTVLGLHLLLLLLKKGPELHTYWK
jgi:hypothetical protein